MNSERRRELLGYSIFGRDALDAARAAGAEFARHEGPKGGSYWLNDGDEDIKANRKYGAAGDRAEAAAAGKSAPAGNIPPPAPSATPAPPPAPVNGKAADPLGTAKKAVADYLAKYPDRAKVVGISLTENPNDFFGGRRSFPHLQRELDALDAAAPDLTMAQWHDKTYFHPPTELQGWGWPEERPVTRQEAEIISAAAARGVPVQPIQPGELLGDRHKWWHEDVDQNNVLRRSPWGDAWRSRHKELVKQALADGRTVRPDVLSSYPDLAAPPADVPGRPKGQNFPAGPFEVEWGSHDPAKSYAVDGKEPWQMTRRDWRDAWERNDNADTHGAVYNLNDRRRRLQMGLGAVRDPMDPRATLPVSHAAVVRAAQLTGKPIPPEVLADAGLPAPSDPADRPPPIYRSEWKAAAPSLNDGAAKKVAAANAASPNPKPSAKPSAKPKPASPAKAAKAVAATTGDAVADLASLYDRAASSTPEEIASAKPRIEAMPMKDMKRLMKTMGFEPFGKTKSEVAGFLFRTIEERLGKAIRSKLIHRPEKPTASTVKPTRMSTADAIKAGTDLGNKLKAELDKAVAVVVRSENRENPDLSPIKALVAQLPSLPRSALPPIYAAIGGLVSAVERLTAAELRKKIELTARDKVGMIARSYC